ncbi:hypothetical protein GUITHDRAFT_110166 [Guillardia theta CCMP2712]|uniref:Uncharacterized protein n=1 Tax=Guillardia theta (strain CCMP2712) TaxID=905079 RepID=L1J6K1_GUITC|nr:hypothetical protein GUITHDRAFT_110166 [Guillardia theta CCMP2712]EKX43710.1 hypothetical protein GUITHDRAFT_110166 [Guillardia theta CCMP2712]|eukprot:XP_005830690.1 hypothetical protein GUITHDRAFT_110166 [Guillardia theta CCMP2712]
MQPRITTIFDKSADHGASGCHASNGLRKSPEDSSETRKQTRGSSLFEEILNADWSDKKKLREEVQEKPSGYQTNVESNVKADQKRLQQEGNELEVKEVLDDEKTKEEKFEDLEAEDANEPDVKLQLIQQSDSQVNDEEKGEGADQMLVSSQLLTQEYSQPTQDQLELTQDSVQPTQEYQGNVFEPLVPASQEDLRSSELAEEPTEAEMRPGKRRRIRAALDSSDEDEDSEYGIKREEQQAEELPDLSNWRVRMELLLRTSRMGELAELLGRDVAARYIKARRDASALAIEDLEMPTYEKLQRILLMRMWEGRDFKVAR